MPTPVSQVPTPFELTAVQTGQPVSSSHILRAAEECSFLGGYCVNTLCAVRIHPRNAARTQLTTFASWDVPFVTVRHPGAHVLAIVATLAPVAGDGAVGATCTLTVNLPVGASWIDAGGLDGTRAFRFPPAGRVAPQEIIGLVDVTNLSAGTLPGNLAYWTLTVTPSATGIGQGLATLRVVEIPRASADPTANYLSDPTWEQAAALHPGPIEDGGFSSPRGQVRFIYLLDQYRAYFRPCVQVCGPATSNNAATATNPHWHKEGTPGGALEWQYSATGAHDFHLYWQVRNLYGVGGGAPSQTYRFVCYYKTSGATAATLTVNLTGAAPAAGQVVNLPATNNVWTWITASITVPADGTGGLVDCSFEADAGGVAEVVQFACFALFDDQG